jgi:hypothetical protein
MTSVFNHNKKRNSGLIYEFLVRRMGLTLVDQDPESYLKTIGIIKRYYSAGQPLAREKDVFDVICRSRGLNENAARRILNEVYKHVQEFDNRKIDIKKSNLIKEIHYAFGKDFFDIHRIPEYRLFASIQMLIEQYRSSSSKSINEGVSKIQLEESVVKYMTLPVGNPLINIKGEKVDSLVATLAMKKFEERYSDALNESQKKTLRRYMNYSMTGNKEQFGREMEEERKFLIESLNNSKELSCFQEDTVMSGRLSEAINSLNQINDMTSESAVQELLLYHKLFSEIQSDE